jgi:uncharacterized protein
VSGVICVRAESLKILIDINHPAHIHYFKNYYHLMKDKGHDVFISASQKEIAFQLLREINLPFNNVGTYGNSIVEKIFKLPLLDARMQLIVNKIKPDLIIGFGSIRGAHCGAISNIDCVEIEDSEPSPLEHALYVPYANVVLTPESFKKDFGRKQIRFPSYIELAYLHPRYFAPNKDELKSLEIDANERYAVIRFVGWQAIHDVGKRGFSIEDKRRLVHNLSQHMRVYISSEKPLPPDLEQYRLKLPYGSIHHLLAFASIFIGDSQTMSTESALLGTPTIRCNDFVGPNDMSNFIELEKRFGLLLNYSSPNEAINRAIEMVSKSGLKEDWKQKREIMLQNKISFTDFLVHFTQDIEGTKADIQFQKNAFWKQFIC